MSNIVYEKLEKIINKVSFLKYRRRRRREKRAKKAQHIASKIYEDNNALKVLTGPFAGMKYPNLVASNSELLPKLIGSYERETHRYIEKLLGSDIERIVNIGAGEGYYAVGLARRNENAEIYAFDIDKKARERCEQMATLNNVSNRIKIFDYCTIEKLKELAENKLNIICDCDGCEYDLFKPENIKYFQNSNILLELHDRENSKGVEGLLALFKDTHSISRSEYSERDPDNYSCIAKLKLSEKEFALDENRSLGFRWALPLEPIIN